jgi:putative salt-induced outer membrane protein YdiY
MIALLLGSLIASTPVDTIKPLKFTIDAGLVSTSGNTDITTVNVVQKLEVISGAWAFGQQFGVIYGRTDGDVTTSLWAGSLRGDRNLSSRVAIFGLGNYDRNTFAGIESRYSANTGIAVKVVDTAKDKLRLEAGGGYTWQRAVDPGVDEDFAGGRTAFLFEHALGAKATFSQGLVFLFNFKTSEDVRINSETAITAPITAGIAMRASYVIRYDRLPEVGSVSTDKILTTGVQLTF